MKSKFAIYSLIFATLVGSYAYYYYQSQSKQQIQNISTFEECASAGYPIMESYPERCSVPGGATFTRVTTDLSPSVISISGDYTCLPKKDTGGPVTLECAFGLKTPSGYYALDTSALISEKYPLLMGNESITVEGYLVPIEMVSTDRFQTYDIRGVISVEKFTLN